MPKSSPQRTPRAAYARRRVGIALGLILITIAAFLVWKGLNFWNKPLSTTAVAPPPRPNADTKRFTVLIVGADERPGDTGRTDTMLLGFVDLNAGSVKLLSVPRDSYAQIAGHGWDKINAAYAFGQEELSRQTLEHLLGIPIDYTVAVNMQGFEHVVDAVGGVDINIDADMNYEDPYDDPPLKIHLTKGPHHLNGIDALHYVRFRHDSQSDWGRMKRQQNFLKALLQAAKQPGNLARIPELLQLATDNVRTNLSPSQLTDMAMLAKDHLTVQSAAGETLSGDDLWSSEGYYLALHLQDARNTVRQLAGVTPNADTQQQDVKDVAAYKAALPEGADTYEGLLQLEAKKSGATAPTKPPASTDGKSNATPTTTGGKPGDSGTTQAPPWSLVVVDGSGGKQSNLLDTLKAQGYQIVSVHAAQGVQQTTIVWYNGPEQAARRLEVLLPNAKFVHLAPGTGDPPLKLILGSK